MNNHQAAKRNRDGQEYIFKPGDNMPMFGSFGPDSKPKFVRVTNNGELIVIKRAIDGVEVAVTVDAFDGVYIKRFDNLTITRDDSQPGLSHTEKIYLFELIKAAENDNAFLSRLIFNIGTFGMLHIANARIALERELS